MKVKIWPEEKQDFTCGFIKRTAADMSTLFSLCMEIEKKRRLIQFRV